MNIPVGAGSARPNTSTALLVDAFGQADPALTGNLVKCGHSITKSTIIAAKIPMQPYYNVSVDE